MFLSQKELRKFVSWPKRHLVAMTSGFRDMPKEQLLWEFKLKFKYSSFYMWLSDIIPICLFIVMYDY